jgi:hypothetical protein
MASLVIRNASVLARITCAHAPTCLYRPLRGLNYLLGLILGLTPQALCYRLLRRLLDCLNATSLKLLKEVLQWL